MSRSYKRYPIVRQEKEDYHYLNKKIRHDKLTDIPDRSGYKRYSLHYNSWKYPWTKEQAIRDYNQNSYIKRSYSYEEWMEHWARSVYRK